MLYKLGAVPYLNALPLIHYLEKKPTHAAPSALARLLKIGEVEIATAPIAALFENPHYSLIPGICIGSNGPVRSVKLFFRSEKINAENIRSIYLDIESRTSALLLKVLLRFKYGRRLDEIDFMTPIPFHAMEGQLLIGDKAMRELPEVPPLDLGYEWTSWTGLPFVYAAWISRLSETSDRALEALTEARNRGVSAIPSVIPPDRVPSLSRDVRLPRDLIEDYLRNIVYHLGPREIEGMELFRDYLLQAGLLETPSNQLKYAIA